LCPYISGEPESINASVEAGFIDRHGKTLGAVSLWDVPSGIRVRVRVNPAAYLWVVAMKLCLPLPQIALQLCVGRRVECDGIRLYDAGHATVGADGLKPQYSPDIVRSGHVSEEGYRKGSRVNTYLRYRRGAGGDSEDIYRRGA